MPSPADRCLPEWGARLALLALLALAWWRAAAPSAPEPRVVDGPALGDALATATRAGHPLHVRLRGAPAPWALAWLRALAAAGVPVAWSGTVAPLAVSARPAYDPRGAVTVRVAAPADTRVAVADALGVVDTVVTTDGGAVLTVPQPAGAVGAQASGDRAAAAVVDAPPMRDVVVFGRADQEAKFVVAALEERGLRVRARFRVAPRSDVAQGAATLDTAQVAAVVVLDSSAVTDGGPIARYVLDGGGVVLAGSASLTPDLAPLVAGAVEPREPGVVGSFEFSPPRRGLSVFPIGRLRPGAVVLESHEGAHLHDDGDDHGDGAGTHAAVAWRAIGSGRVLQFGYDDTWRWRMLDDAADAPARHRDLWLRAVAAVAYHPSRAAAVDSVVAAPRAAVAAALGAPSDPPSRRPPSPTAWPAWIFLTVSLLLVGEVASRRRRGAP
jgi:hypothetical protein